MENDNVETNSERFVAFRRKTPLYALVFVFLPWLIAAVLFIFRAEINAVYEDLGYILFTVCLFLPILVAFLFSRHYNLFSRQPLTIIFDKDGVCYSEGNGVHAYSWPNVKQILFVSQMTPGGYFRFMKIVTIKQIYDKRRNQTRCYYPAFDFFFYGFDKTEQEILDAVKRFNS
ncbi:MAG: hypothetical protein MJZ23_06715 [Paludibacteraceae bacterium]|nr:hypothetical protein [Paludibacteraceae bacterium]